MKAKSPQLVVYRSKTYSKVKVNLVFTSDAVIADRAKEELQVALKSLYLEKYFGSLQEKTEALLSYPLEGKTTEKKGEQEQ